MYFPLNLLHQLFFKPSLVGGIADGFVKSMRRFTFAFGYQDDIFAMINFSKILKRLHELLSYTLTLILR